MQLISFAIAPVVLLIVHLLKRRSGGAIAKESTVHNKQTSAPNVLSRLNVTNKTWTTKTNGDDNEGNLSDGKGANDEDKDLSRTGPLHGLPTRVGHVTSTVDSFAMAPPERLLRRWTMRRTTGTIAN